jgi:hypothetical protein
MSASIAVMTRRRAITRTILCMPVTTKKGSTVAVVQLLNKLNNLRFNDQDERSFREFAASIGVILESCSSFYSLLPAIHSACLGVAQAFLSGSEPRSRKNLQSVNE